MLVNAKDYPNSMEMCVSYDANSNVITISCNANLESVNKFINDKKVLEKDPLGVWILKSTIVVNPSAELTINDRDTNWLKITNNIDNTPNFIKILGSAEIDNVKITSWNTQSNETIGQNVNGSIPRPFILIENSDGNVNVKNSEIGFLGNNSYPLSGLVYIHGGNGSIIANNAIHDLWDGFYSDSAQSIAIKNNYFYNNLRHGIDTDTGSHDFKIIENSAYNNNNTGILCSDRCQSISFYNNTSHDNGEFGFRLSSDTHNSISSNNHAFNEKVGFQLTSSSNNKLHNNTVNLSDIGIQIAGNSFENHVFNNTIMNTRVGIDFEDNSTQNILENNTFYNVNNSIHFNG
jgi:parallel beta-helix repeat protein